MDRFVQEEKSIGDLNNAYESSSAYSTYSASSLIRKKNKSMALDSRVLVFALSVCVGMIFFYMAGTELIDKGKLPEAFVQDNISRLHGMELDKTALFESVLDERLGELALMAICAVSFAWRFFAYAILGYVGFEVGIVAFAFIYQYGFRGLLFSVLILMPHGIFYAFAFLLLFYRLRQDIRAGASGKLVLARCAALIILLWLIGILSEVYVNSELIKDFAAFF